MARRTTTKATEVAETHSTRDEVPAYDLFVDDSTKDNYRQMARDLADTDGCTPAEALAKLADGFDRQAESDPTGGWNHLAAWARDEKTPPPTVEDNLAAAEEARAIESAVRDPRSALRSSPAAVEAAEAELLRRTSADARPDGTVPNTGPAEGVDAAEGDTSDPERED